MPTGKVTPFPVSRRAGRPVARVPDTIDPKMIAVMAQYVDPDDDEKVRLIAEVPGWLKDLIEKSAPRGTSIKTVILYALQNAGYPITDEELKTFQELDE